MIGYCRFCGQSKMVDGDPGMSEEELNQLATSECTCPGAVREAWKNSVLEEYDQNLEVLFGKKPELKKLMRAAGELIMNEKIEKLTITEAQGKTIGLKPREKGLCITITNKTKEETMSYG